MLHATPWPPAYSQPLASSGLTRRASVTSMCSSVAGWQLASAAEGFPPAAGGAAGSTIQQWSSLTISWALWEGQGGGRRARGWMQGPMQGPQGREGWPGHCGRSRAAEKGAQGRMKGAEGPTSGDGSLLPAPT